MRHTCSLTACLALLLAASSARAEAPGPTLLGDKVIYAGVDDPQLQGEGFSVYLSGGEELFVAEGLATAPKGVDNARLHLLAVINGKGSVRLPEGRPVELYLASRYDLGAEHRRLAQAEYPALVAEVRKRHQHRRVRLVAVEELAFTDAEQVIACERITGLEREITQTTGGSAWLFTVHLKDSADLNVASEAAQRDERGVLAARRADIESCAQRRGRLVLRDATFIDTIYTFAGTRRGWVVNYAKVTVEAQ